MVDLLSSFVTTRRHLSESQGSFSPSQGSSQSSEESLGECPADDHYDQLLHVDGHRLYTDTDQLHIYIHLVFTLTYKYMLTDPTLKNILQANRSFESKSMCQKCASLATKDELSIQNEFTSGTVTCNQSDVTDSKLTGLKNSSKTIQCSECQRKHLKLVLKQTGYHEMCSGETNRCVRREVGVVLNIDRYIESFEKHLLKICKPGSEDSIKENYSYILTFDLIIALIALLIVLLKHKTGVLKMQCRCKIDKDVNMKLCAGAKMAVQVLKLQCRCKIVEDLTMKLCAGAKMAVQV
ncbi:hypothetical protein MAR_036944 [Mya arenaria]|uniref:Uncharacterized protein n=1 Tax=Mya arenaria TaxID=6604 RepID=A0ABY7FM25_MYAAR|nr:hypothetical protein MAR_036944 [Mya arenaria]